MYTGQDVRYLKKLSKRLSQCVLVPKMQKIVPILDLGPIYTEYTNFIFPVEFTP